MGSAKKGSPGKKPQKGKNGSGARGDVLSNAKIRTGVDVLHGFAPRVWCTLGQKIQINQYEPVDINFGFSKDVREGRSRDAVAADVVKFVRKTIKPVIAAAEKIKEENVRERKKRNN